MIFGTGISRNKHLHGLKDTNEDERSVVDGFMLFPCFVLGVKAGESHLLQYDL